MQSHYPLLIVGAGAAGIGAAQAAQAAGIDYLVLEASHRVGGRGLTEELAPGIPWDLGCHWLHSGGINPLAKVADSLGAHYDVDHPSRAFYWQGSRVSLQLQQDYEQYMARQWQQVDAAGQEGRDTALADLIDYDSQWAPYYVYWQSLMTSHDVDRFSALDIYYYEDTGEDWPLRDGYGALLQRHAQGLAIKLNTAVNRIEWGGKGVRVQSSAGVLTADRLVITVSTGVLGGRDIEFSPSLPAEKLEAIEQLPMGCYNNFAMLYDEPWPFDEGTPERIDYSDGNDVNFAFKLRCSGWPYIYCAVAGRQARWLERQPAAASQDLMMGALTDIFGSDFKRRIAKFKSSAWGDDPLIKGAFSASQPGYANQRGVLAEPLAERLYFAGEATSKRAFCTAHGAWQSGRDAVIASKPAST
jgi:monoamine oxidase